MGAKGGDDFKEGVVRSTKCCRDGENEEKQAEADKYGFEISPSVSELCFSWDWNPESEAYKLSLQPEQVPFCPPSSLAILMKPYL